MEIRRVARSPLAILSVVLPVPQKFVRCGGLARKGRWRWCRDARCKTSGRSVRQRSGPSLASARESPQAGYCARCELLFVAGGSNPSLAVTAARNRCCSSCSCRVAAGAVYYIGLSVQDCPQYWPLQGCRFSRERWIRVFIVFDRFLQSRFLPLSYLSRSRHQGRPWRQFWLPILSSH